MDWGEEGLRDDGAAGVEEDEEDEEFGRGHGLHFEGARWFVG